MIDPMLRRIRVCSYTNHSQKGLARCTAQDDHSTHVRVGGKFVSHALELCMAGDGHDAVHDVVLFEEFCEHLGGTDGVHIGSHENDDGGSRSGGGTAVSGKDLRVGFAI